MFKDPLWLFLLLGGLLFGVAGLQKEERLIRVSEGDIPVSYTHLTLPTILRV